MPDDMEYESWAEERGVTSVPLKQEPTRITMDDYGLKLAEVVRLRAACNRRQVGAVVIGPDKRIVATGYNGVEPGATECSDGGCPRGAYTHDQIPGFLGNAGHKVPCVAIHAEDNAIRYAAAHADDLTDCTLYVSCQPCPDCARKAEAYGLRVVWPW